MGIKLFNLLQLNLKQLYTDVKWFKLKLKEFLSRHSFYILDEYIEYSSWRDWFYTGSFYVPQIIILYYFVSFIYLPLF
jgi:hypothetical protein